MFDPSLLPKQFAIGAQGGKKQITSIHPLPDRFWQGESCRVAAREKIDAESEWDLRRTSPLPREGGNPPGGAKTLKGQVEGDGLTA